MTANGQYNGEFERLIRIVEDIDDRTQSHTNLLGSMSTHLETIAINTGTVAKHYEVVQSDNRTLTQSLNRVLLAVLVLVAIYAIADNLKDSSLDIRVPWLGIEIVQHDDKGGE